MLSPSSMAGEIPEKLTEATRMFRRSSNGVCSSKIEKAPFKMFVTARFR